MNFHTLVGIFIVAFELSTYLQRCDCICSAEFAKHGQFPFSAKINQNRVFRCGGSIISDRWIITSAWCLQPLGNKELGIALGAHGKYIYGDEYIVNRIVVHEEYDGEGWENDIALIETNTFINKSDFVQPIPLRRGYAEAHLEVDAIGWGKRYKNKYVDGLAYLKVDTISNDQCSELLSDKSVNNGTLCTYAPKFEGSYGFGVCGNDVGGSLVFDYTLIGIISRNTAEFSSGMAHRYTRISEYLNWIEENTDIGAVEKFT